jgi:hypothetical protein
MRLVFFKGQGVFSRLIRWFSRGRFDHVAILDDERGELYEARARCGVVVSPAGPRLALSPPFEVFSPVERLGVIERAIVRDFLRGELGKPYDLPAVLKFVTRRRETNPAARWFCSELAVEAFRVGGRVLMRAPAWKISPEVLSYSPALRHE